MHRHGYQGRKLQLAAGPRRALIRGQLTSLVLHEAITTTEAKAKEVAPRFERLVTYAKRGTLAGGRALRRELLTENATQKMIAELAPAFAERQGGYTRIIKLGNRRGDNAPMARLSLVLDDVKIVSAPVAESKPAVKTAKPATKTTKTAAKAEAK
ncbi:50S ribosomal protein L17 [Candidatus Saccharibacteria bacterium]|nr:50S ribosomal protein L17 [Candidatus Saccharibacteria bacterium]